MEMSGQDKEMGMTSSFSYNNNKLNGDSSLLKISSSAPINPPRTLDYHTEPNPEHQIDNLSRDLGQDPDPASAPFPTLQRPAISSTHLIRSYRECLKNHAASKGGQVFDGCGEFMPSGEDGTQESLKCAACECHRNFHRKEINGESQYPTTCTFTHNPYQNNTRRDSTNVHPQQPTPLRQQSQYPCLPIAPVNVMMNFGGANGGRNYVGGPMVSSSEDLNMFDSNAGGPQSSKKRFRTKFSQDQKNKMLQFAEKLGWRIQKQDEQEVQQFCGQVGVKRRVLKVWMHNSKQAMKRKKNVGFFVPNTFEVADP